MFVDAGFPKGGYVSVMGGAFIAGFFASACSLPFDFVKTRMQKMQPMADGTMPYKNSLDCAMKTLAQVRWGGAKGGGAKLGMACRRRTSCGLWHGP
eukprot:366045-Chlamydomonas_euryale.AAC.17